MTSFVSYLSVIRPEKLRSGVFFGIHAGSSPYFLLDSLAEVKREVREKQVVIFMLLIFFRYVDLPTPWDGACR